MADADRKPVKHTEALFMKKICLILAAVLSLAALSCCSGKDQDHKTGQDEALSGNAGGSGIYDIFSKKEQIIAVEAEDLKGTLTGAQFYQGEPVMLSAYKKSADGKESCDIYLYPQDGEARLVAEGLPPEVSRNAGFGFLGEDGCYYHISGGTLGTSDAVITKYDNTGNKLFFIERKNAVNLQMCSLADGKIMLFYKDAEKNDFHEHNDILEYLDTTTGAVSEIKLTDPTDYNVWLGTDGTDPYLLDSYGIYRVDPDTGSITLQLRFSGSYGLDRSTRHMEGGSICSFQVNKNGDIGLLWERRLSTVLSASMKVPPGTAWLETVQRKEINGNKTFLTLRGLSLVYDEGLKKKVVEFNSRSDNYYVLIEDCEDDLLEDDYITRTLVELGTGKGPDILYERPILGNSLYSLIENGVLEDLSPYMERSGIKREDYFPLAFDSCRDGEKIYEIILEAWIRTQLVDSRLFGSVDGMDINMFLDTLLTLGDKAVYQADTTASDLLRDFLEGSGNLWGMVNWESGTCNFDTDLFTKLLQAAKNLEDSGRKSYIPISEEEYYLSFFSFAYQRSQMSEAQMVLGKPFDDGFHGKVAHVDSLVINSNSPNKEGAWEFVSYLLSQEAQETLRLPVHRGAFAAAAEKAKATNSPPPTQEDVSDLEALLMEDVRVLPIRVQPLLDIIIDEAQDYFEGTKSIDQVRTVVKNRVQLYLDERH